MYGSFAKRWWTDHDAQRAYVGNSAPELLLDAVRQATDLELCHLLLISPLQP